MNDLSKKTKALDMIAKWAKKGGIPVAAFLFGSVVYVNANSECSHSITSFRCVTYLENYDGDTIKVNIPSVHPLLGKEASIRVKNIDVAELRSSDPCEVEVAKRAKEFTGSLLRGEGTTIHLENIERGKYFRILSDVRYSPPAMDDLLDLGSALIVMGYAVPYDGGTKPDVDWCGVFLETFRIDDE